MNPTLRKSSILKVGRQLSLITGLDTSNVSRRCDAARLKLETNRKLNYAKAQVEKIYLAKLAESPT